MLVTPQVNSGRVTDRDTTVGLFQVARFELGDDVVLRIQQLKSL
jgi:hypothetical protein